MLEVLLHSVLLSKAISISTFASSFWGEILKLFSVGTSICNVITADDARFVISISWLISSSIFKKGLDEPLSSHIIYELIGIKPCDHIATLYNQ